MLLLQIGLENTVYARGACDMKGQLATIVALLYLLNQNNINIPFEVIIYL